jgi:sugar O-acyltransferase (sialic acid O-acetyltransferase NeuD family)
MYLCGAGGHAKVIIDILEANGIHIDGLFENDKTIHSLLDYPVFHTDRLKGPLIISVGNNKIRKKIAFATDVEWGRAIHPSAIISKRATVDVGTVIMQGAIIQSCANTGKHCIVNTGASVDHECIIHDFVHVSPHATLCGNVEVGEGTWIGAGATVIQGVKIGKWSTVGAGSVVTGDIPDHVVAYGSPCKVIRSEMNIII